MGWTGQGPTVTNFAKTARLGAAPLVRGRAGPGTVLLGPGSSVRPSDATDGLVLESTETVPRPWVSPGGARGDFRLGLQPGNVYTTSVTFSLPRRLVGAPHSDRLRIVVWSERNGSLEKIASSPRPANERGETRVWVTFRVPSDATAAWLRIHGGTAPGDVVEVSALSATRTSVPLAYFDGDSPTDRWYDYAWTGKPHHSESLRTMRHPSESFPDGTAPVDIADEVVGRLRLFLHEEAAALIDHLRTVTGDSALPAVCEQLADEARALEQLAVEDPALRGEDAAAVRHRTTQALEKMVDPTLGSDADSWLRTLIVERSVGFTVPRPDAERFAALLRPVVEDPGAPPRSHYLLGHVLDNSVGYYQGAQVDAEEAARIVRAAAARDRGLPFDAAEAVADEPRRFAGRMVIGSFVAEHLDRIRQRSAYTEDLVDHSLGEAPAFMYWHQGFADAPPVVRVCRDALLRHHPAGDVHLLDDTVVPYYSELPDRIVSGTEGRRAHFAGALRLDLLVRYGGYWVDATCYTASPLVESVPLERGFAAFERSPGRISSWFLAARQESYLVRTLRAAVWTWWDERQDLPEYLLLPGLFEMLYRLDQRFRAEWDSVDAPSAGPPHALQLAMRQPGSAAHLDRLLAAAPLHKLIFSYDPATVPLDSALALLMRRG